MKNENVEDLARQKRNEYHRTWQKQNPEKVKQAQERYWKKKAKETYKKGEDQ